MNKQEVKDRVVKRYQAFKFTGDLDDSDVRKFVEEDAGWNVDWTSVTISARELWVWDETKKEARQVKEGEWIIWPTTKAEGPSRGLDPMILSDAEFQERFISHRPTDIRDAILRVCDLADESTGGWGSGGELTEQVREMVGAAF